MLLLPLLDAQILPCPAAWGQMPPHPSGRHCTQCERLVHDFTPTANLPAALAAVRATSADGRVCGRFAAAQVARPRLSARLRRFVVALVLVVGLGLSAREALAQVRQASKTSRSPAGAPDFVGVTVEQMPYYKGSRAALQAFLKQHLHYPPGATKTGRIFIKSMVDEHGKPRDFEIIKGLEPVLDAEALRVMHLLGNFTPGKQSGKPVAVSFTLPVTFSLR